MHEKLHSPKCKTFAMLSILILGVSCLSSIVTIESNEQEKNLKNYLSSLFVNKRGLSVGSKNVNFTSLYGVTVGKLSDPFMLNDVPVFLDLFGGRKSSFLNLYSLSRCIDPSTLESNNITSPSKSKEHLNIFPKKILYTDSLCTISQYIRPKERVRVFLILRNPSEQTLLSFDLKKNIKRPDFDKTVHGLHFSTSIRSISLVEADHMTKSMLCKEDSDDVITAYDFNELRQFLKSHAVIETFKGYKSATVSFQQEFFGWISSLKTNSKIETCIHRVIEIGRNRFGQKRGLVDIDSISDHNDDMLRNINKYDTMLYATLSKSQINTLIS